MDSIEIAYPTRHLHQPPFFPDMRLCVTARERSGIKCSILRVAMQVQVQVANAILQYSIQEGQPSELRPQ